SGAGEWKNARWYNGMDAVRTCREKKTILCGHWHTSYGHSKFERKGSEFGADAAAQDAAAGADNGVVSDPAKEEPFLVRSIVATYDFGSGAKASDAADAGETAAAEGEKEEKEGEE
ncbi:MAG: hypothetical protein J5727_02165, partial [Kiritimatiellae bacterium]|nr:hypothetical protein [Kiritimatiellia bacterium]